MAKGVSTTSTGGGQHHLSGCLRCRHDDRRSGRRSRFYGQTTRELDIARGVIERLGDTTSIIGRPPVGGTFPYTSTIGMEEYLVRMITDPDIHPPVGRD